MKKIVIRGSSDDLIEVEDPDKGKDNLTNEFGAFPNGETFVLVASTDALDVFAVTYNGRWHVKHHVVSGALTFDNVKATDDDTNYSDTATVTGPIVSVNVIGEWPPTVRRMRRELRYIELRDHLTGMSDEDVLTITEILTGIRFPKGTVIP